MTGQEPRTAQRRKRIRIEADLPESLSPADWQTILTALESADRFGLDGGPDGRTVWAEIYKTPATVQPVRGRGHSY